VSKMAKATKKEMLKLASAFEEQASTLPEESIFGDVNDLEGMRQSAVLCRQVAMNLGDVEWLESKRAFFVRLIEANQDDEFLYDRYEEKMSIIEFALGLDTMMYNDMVGG